MPNTVYLSCGIANRIYPSNQEDDYDPAQQTVASAAYAIPMLWFACFRPEDWKEATLKDEDGCLVQVSAPVVDRQLLQARLNEALPRLQALFPKSGSFKSHAKALRDTIATVHRAYRFLTIEWEEVAGMGDPQEFDHDARQILNFMAGQEVPDVRDLLIAMSSFNPDRKVASVSAHAKSPDVPIEDWNNLYALAGCGYSRDVLWIPQIEPEPVVESAIVQAARACDFAKVWDLIQAGADLTIEDKEGIVLQSLMTKMAGMRRDDRAEVRAWLPKFLDAKAIVNDHALGLSASISPFAEFALLFSLNGNPNARNLYNFPVFMEAATSQLDPVEKMKLLIAAGADPNLRQSYTLGSGSIHTCGVLDQCVPRDLFEPAKYALQQGLDPKHIESAYWAVRANKKGAIKERWLKIFEGKLNPTEPE